jgi:hypothetical protein
MWYTYRVWCRRASPSLYATTSIWCFFPPSNSLTWVVRFRVCSLLLHNLQLSDGLWPWMFETASTLSPLLLVSCILQRRHPLLTMHMPNSLVLIRKNFWPNLWSIHSMTGELSLAFVISKPVLTRKGLLPYSCLKYVNPLYLLGDKDLWSPSFLELFKEEGEHKGIWPISLFGGLSTTPSSIVTLDNPIVEDTPTIENMKKPLLFTNDNLAFPNSNDSVLVAPTKNDFNIIEKDCSNYFGPRTTTYKLHDK